MPPTMVMMLAGAAAVTAAAAWWLIRRVRQWRTAVRLRRVQSYHAGLRAELELSYERIYTRCAARPAWSQQKLADMEWAFAQIDAVLEKRRRQELAEVGRHVPAVAPPVVPAVLGVAGAAALVAATVVDP